MTGRGRGVVPEPRPRVLLARRSPALTPGSAPIAASRNFHQEQFK